MKIKYARLEDKDFVMNINSHINEISYNNLVYTKSGYVLWEDDNPIGFMTHCMLWNQLPFLNLIYVKESYRNRGFGSQAMKFWEDDMRKQGYQMVLISTQADESAQNFYRKLGYMDCGALLFTNTPIEQPTELFLRKIL